MDEFLNALIVEFAKENMLDRGIRTGQQLFLHLPPTICNKVSGTLFDPFHHEWSWAQVREWCDNHLIFDDNGEIIALFNNNEILIERVTYTGDRVTPEQRKAVENVH